MFRKLFNLNISLPSDKLLHGIAGGLICLYAFAISYRFLALWLCFLVANGLALTALFLKELYDMTHAGHSAEWGDILAGAVGMAIVDAAMGIMVL